MIPETYAIVLKETGLPISSISLHRNDLAERGDDFEWLPFERLKDEYFYPIFLKSEIDNLPESFTIRTEFE